MFKAFQAARAGEAVLSKADRAALGEVVLKWARGLGATASSHWFSAMRGVTHGEKLDTFVSRDFASGESKIAIGDLFQSETDGSSFPNGGLRATHTAAAFMAWDLESPPFVDHGTLYIPSVFVSWRGDALDQKTPLIRAEHAVNQQGSYVYLQLIMFIFC